MDVTGKPIHPGGKHHIVFADRAKDKQPLTQVHVVESYKKYNISDDDSGEKNCCRIF